MIKITVNKSKTKPLDLIDPCKMINTPYGTIFQQYVSDKPVNDFYISCGHAEPSVIHVWYDEEDKNYKLSTDTFKSLKGLASHVKVLEVDATIELIINT